MLILFTIFQANMWLGNLLLDRSDDIYRMKGLLSVDGMDERFVFQVIINYAVDSFIVLPFSCLSEYYCLITNLSKTSSTISYTVKQSFLFLVP